MKECLEDRLLIINLPLLTINQEQLLYNNNFIKLITIKGNIKQVLKL